MSDPVSGALSRQEQTELARLEQVVADNMAGFRRAGEALARIQEAKLYRQDYASFPDYLRQRWNLGRSQGYRLIVAAETAEVLATGQGGLSPQFGDAPLPPARESQMRPLSNLPDAQSQRDAWHEAVASAGGHQPTAQQIETAAELVAARRLQALAFQALASLPPDEQLKILEQEETEILDRAAQRKEQAERDVQRELLENLGRHQAKLRKLAGHYDGNVDTYLAVLDTLDRELERL